MTLARVINIRNGFPADLTDFVFVGRPSKWGNPFKIGIDGTREQVIQRYREWLFDRPDLLASLSDLRAKTLGCWCVPLPCHATVLADLVNRTEPKMNSDEYTDWTLTTSIYPGAGKRTSEAQVYTGLGLVGEAGEYLATLEPVVADALNDPTVRGDDVLVLSRLLQTIRSVKLACAEAEKLKKEIRGGVVKLPTLRAFTQAEQANVSKERGDVGFYWHRGNDEHGLKSSDVIAENVKKLSDRKTRGVLHGSGDSR